MTIAVVYSRAQEGVNAPLVTVEVHLSNGLPGLSIVGLPETAVKESKDRVRSAIINSHFEFPLRRITINLAPADLPKEGGRFDLPIALGILAASGQIPASTLQQYEFVGELALNGSLRTVHGILAASIAAHNTSRALVCPRENAEEAALVEDATVYGSQHLLDICAHLADSDRLEPQAMPYWYGNVVNDKDMSEVCGQHHARRALEIAAAGGHSLLMIGPPGTGKTMLASRLPTILPLMTEDEALETATIASLCGQKTGPDNWKIRPFRNPHHTASGVALVGGGSNPRPGEISLAHNGVLFLDELPEFERRVLEVLREPLESGQIVISRAARQAIFPARFQLIAAMNPCPCGYLGDHSRCRCSPDQIRRYRNRISGPLLDRIDIHLEVPRMTHHEIYNTSSTVNEPSSKIVARVACARQRQLGRASHLNHLLSNREVKAYCKLTEQDQQLLEDAMEKLGLSARAYHRILKLARTIADLDDSKRIHTQHIVEAISFRKLDRSYAPGSGNIL